MTQSRGFMAFVLVVVLVLGGGLAAAQDGGEPVEAVEVSLAAADGLTLVGDYYAVQADDEVGAPAVLLLHMLGSNRTLWDPLIPDLTGAGYTVLAVDMRGHGATGGAQDWPLAESDVQAWLDWLREQPGVDAARLNVVGGSIGGNLALRGMANDPQVVTAVALSPGLDYRGVTTEDALATIGERPVYLVAGQGDRYSADSVRTLAGQMQGDGLLRLFNSAAHGTNLLPGQITLGPSVVAWLDWHNWAE